MSDEVWKRETVVSPCVKLCVIHPETQLCTGCARSIHEITSWGSLPHETRIQIIADLPTRKAVPTKRRGGRAARRARRETS